MKKVNEQINMDMDFLEDEEERDVMKMPNQVEPPKHSITEEDLITMTEDYKTKTGEISEKVIAMYLSGATMKMIQKECEVSSGTIYDILARNDIPLRNGRNKKSKSQQQIDSLSGWMRDEIIDEYKNGTPVTEIFSSYQINKHGLYILLAEEGVDTRTNRGTYASSKKSKRVYPEYKDIFSKVSKDVASGGIPTERVQPEKDFKTDEDNTLTINISKDYLIDIDTIKINLTEE